MSEETKSGTEAKPVAGQGAVKQPVEAGQRVARLLALFRAEGESVRAKMDALEKSVAELGGKISSETRTKIATDLQKVEKVSKSLWPDIVDEVHSLLTSAQSEYDAAADDDAAKAAKSGSEGTA